MLTLKSRVATREGGVDRNFEGGAEGGGLLDVATREGGVDRNPFAVSMTSRGCVATREGGVDRNEKSSLLLEHGQASPPARVAWIETGMRRC